MAHEPRFRDQPAFSETLDAAAEQLGISATAIEKDYWVSQVLRGLCRELSDAFVFKGGTSLSKAYHLVERFSEDIDLLVLPGGRGREATDKLMKRMADVAASEVGGTATSTGSSETGRHRAYEISYPATRAPTQLVRTTVLLEMGVRGGDHPSNVVPVGCLLGDTLAQAGTDITVYSDLQPVEVAVLHPGRTLIEKLVLVHAQAIQIADDPDSGLNGRIGRHFYDIHQLLADRAVQDLLANRQEFQAILNEIGAVTTTHFSRTGTIVELRPEGGFAMSPAFTTGEISQRFRVTYGSTMPELYYGATPLPTWDDICRSVTAAAPLL